MDELFGNEHCTKVIVAEDDWLCAKAMEELLEIKGFTAEVVNNGVDVVKLFEKSEIGEYHVILLDCNMPVMNGYEAASAIRKLDRSDAEEVKLIICTGDAYESQIDKVKMAGANDCLVKPIDVDILVKKINE